RRRRYRLRGHRQSAGLPQRPWPRAGSVDRVRPSADAALDRARRDHCLAPVPIGPADRLKVTIEDAGLCPRYAAASGDVKIGPAPQWMADRLLAAGVRPISSIVDITNYVNLEIGQPMHAFDLEKLAGAEIRVRRAKPGEMLVTRDGVERRLEPDRLVIADRDRAQAVAGGMGGAASQVSRTTKRIAYESAYVPPP